MSGCKISGCNGELYRKTGVCETHYQDLTCQIIDCEKPYYCKGYCENHYKSIRRSKNLYEKENDAMAEYAKRVLSYDKETGIFRWKEHKVIKLGTVAGCKNKRGYIQIYLMDRPYVAHRLAWLLVTGAWPKGQIDHKDTVRTNNVFSNLRLATSAQNSYNRGIQSNNKLGLKGVRLSKRPGRRKHFQARIKANGKVHNLGYYMTAEEAHLAYTEAAKALHGEFWRND